MSTLVKIYGFALKKGSRKYCEIDITYVLDDDIPEQDVIEAVFEAFRDAGVDRFVRRMGDLRDRVTVGFQAQHEVLGYVTPDLKEAAKYESLYFWNDEKQKYMRDKARRYINKQTGKIISRRAYMRLQGIIPEIPKAKRVRYVVHHDLSDLQGVVKKAVANCNFQEPKKSKGLKGKKIKLPYKKEWQKTW